MSAGLHKPSCKKGRVLGSSEGRNHLLPGQRIMTSWKTTVLYGVNVNRTDLISHSPRKWRRLPADLRWPRQFWDLADRLRKRFKERVIEKILGLNFLNYSRSVWGG